MEVKVFEYYLEYAFFWEAIHSHNSFVSEKIFSHVLYDWLKPILKLQTKGLFSHHNTIIN